MFSAKCFLQSDSQVQQCDSLTEFKESTRFRYSQWTRITFSKTQGNPNEKLLILNKDWEQVEHTLKNLEKENHALKVKIKEVEAEVEHEKFEEKRIKLQLAYENAKAKSENVEKQIGEFREEVLILKREKT